MTTDVTPTSSITPEVPHRRPPLSGWRWFALGAGVFVAVYLLLVLLTRGDVPRDVRVQGVAIGGLNKAAAVSKLQQRLGSQATAPIHATVAGQAVDVQPASAGLALDAGATVDKAVRRTLNPIEMVRQFLVTTDIAPVTTYDQQKLSASVAAIAGQIDVKPREGDVTFKGVEVVPVDAVQGRVLDQGKAVEALRSSYLVSSKVVELPVTTTEPKIGQSEVDRIVSTFARPAVALPISLVVADRTIDLSPAAVVKYVDFVADANNTLQPQLDVAGFKASIAAKLSGLETQPVDARFALVNGAPQVIPSQAGYTVPDAAMSQAVLAALPATDEAKRRATVELTLTQPKLTTEAAQGLGVKEVVSTFTTRYPYAAYRLQNIHRAADLVNGTVLMPGDTFSLNKAVGERTAANGFAIGTIINHGKFEKDYGGGTSQVATTTFNAMFFAGLKDVQHRPHSFYISRYPAGREATVAWPDLDLQFQNDSGNAIYIQASYTSSTVTVTMWGTKKYDIESVSGPRTNPKAPKTVYEPRTEAQGCVPQDAVDGFNIVVTRVFKQNGVEVKREDFRTHYDPADHIICGSTGPPPPAPPASPTPSVPASPPATPVSPSPSPS